MRILVTGGFGFIGSAFVDQAVNEGHEVVIIDKMTYAADRSNLSESVLGKISHYKIDIAQSVELFTVLNDIESFDWIVNFAAESHVDRSIKDGTDFVLSNVLGLTNLLEYAKSYAKIRILQVSTDEVYGTISDGSWTEDSHLAPRSPYSASKASAELFCQAYSTTHNVKAFITRCANNFGPRQSCEKLIPKVIRSIQASRKIPIYGDGSNRREWIYVYDHVKALLMIIKMEGEIESTIFNISGLEMSNLEIVRKIVSYMGASEELIEYVADRPGHDFRYSVSDNRIKIEVGEYRNSSFDNQLFGTVDWYLSNKDWMARSEGRLLK